MGIIYFFGDDLALLDLLELLGVVFLGLGVVALDFELRVFISFGSITQEV